jgi:hypothetical protein
MLVDNTMIPTASREISAGELWSRNNCCKGERMRYRSRLGLWVWVPNHILFIA